MIITKLKLKNFKKFENKELEFRKGVNVVYGPNEAGKSTIVDSIFRAFYGDVNSRAKKGIFDRASWQSNRLFNLELEFKIDDNEFVLTKDFENKVVKLQDVGNKKVYENENVLARFAEGVLGITSPSVFYSTAFISQNQISLLNIDKDLTRSVQTSLLGMSNIDPMEAIKELKLRYSKMGVGLTAAAKNPGILKSLQNEILQRSEKVKEIRTQIDKIKTAYTQKETSGDQLKDLNEKIELLEKQFENQKIYDEATNQVVTIDDQANKLGRDIAEIERISLEKESFRKLLENFSNLAGKDLNSISEKLSGLVGEIKGMVKMYEEMKKDFEEVAEELPTKRKQRIEFVISGVTFAISLVLSYFFKSFVYIGVGLALSAISYLITKRLTRSEDRDIKKTKDMRNDLEAKRTEIVKKEEELKALLKEVKCESPDEFFAQKAKYITLKEKSRELELSIQGKLNGRLLRSMKQEQIDLFTKKKEIETTKLTEEVRNSRVLPEDYLKKRRELDMLKLEKNKKTEESITSKVKVEESQYSTDDLVKEEEILGNLESDYAFQTKKYLALEVAIKALEETVHETLKGGNLLIEEGIEKYLSELTEGRYENVKIDKNYNIEIYSKEKEDFAMPDELSKGTLDLIYLLARLAILDVVDSDKRVPLVLDDPFVTFDLGRRTKAKELLSNVASERQVLYFTCHEGYEKWGNLIEL